VALGVNYPHGVSRRLETVADLDGAIVLEQGQKANVACNLRRDENRGR
jgi:hypothetical protein